MQLCERDLWEARGGMSASPVDLPGQTVDKKGCKAGIHLNKCCFFI